MSVSSKRILNSFTTAAQAQAESLRCIVSEAERYARDCTLLAILQVAEKAAEKGGKLETGDVADVFNGIFREDVEGHRLAYLACQARKRQETRNRHRDPFATVTTTLKQLRGTANGRED